MLINNSYNNQPSFKCIKIETGGLNLVAKEGTNALSKIAEAQLKYRTYKWHLNITQNDYSLTSPTTKKTYKGPFSVKRHVIKKTDKPDEYSVIIRMNDQKKERYTVNFDTKQEVQLVYKEIKTSKGLNKMIKLLETLEHGLNIKTLRKKIKKIKD